MISGGRNVLEALMFHVGGLLQVVDAGAVPELTIALRSQYVSVVTAAAWTVQHSAMHGSWICDQYAASKILSQMVLALQAGNMDSGPKNAIIRAVKEVVKHCMLPAPLFILISTSCPAEVAVAGLSRLHTLLTNSVVGRREFVTTGTIMELQVLEAELGPIEREGILAINSLFPKDLVAYYRSRI